MFKLENYVLQIYSGGSDSATYGSKIFMRMGGSANTTPVWTNWNTVAELGTSG